MEVISKFLKNIDLFRRIGRPKTQSLPLLGGLSVTALFLLSFTPGLLLLKLALLLLGLATWGLALVWWTEDVQSSEQTELRTGHTE
jgi:hypothetical protein